MQLIKSILLSLWFLTILNANKPIPMNFIEPHSINVKSGAEALELQVAITCDPGEHLIQGTTTCVFGDITDPPGLYVPNCTEGERLLQGISTTCISTPTVTPPGAFLPNCAANERLIQGTSTCIKIDQVIVHHNAAGGDSSDYGEDITLDAVGNVYVTGRSYNSDGNTDMTIWKYKSDGTLDSSFGTDGIVVHHNAAGGNGRDKGEGITLDASGNIYVTGSSMLNYNTHDMVIWKYNSDGTLDSTFGVNGIVVHNSAAGGDDQGSGSDITLDAADNIYVTGYSNNDNDNDMTIWKYKSDGTRDNTFGTGGIVVHNSAAGGNGHDYGSDITLDAAGNVYVTGYSMSSVYHYDMVIWKYQSDGTLDGTFGVDGIVVHNSAAGGNGSDRGYEVALDTAVNIYVTGYSYNSDGNSDMVIWKYKNDGMLDNTFGTDGIVVYNTTTEGNNHDRGYGVTLDATDNIYVTGYSWNSSNKNDMIIWKYKSDGMLDNTFGTDGIVVHHNAAGGNSNDEGHGITLDLAGNLYVTGFSISSDYNDDMVTWIYYQ